MIDLEPNDGNDNAPMRSSSGATNLLMHPGMPRQPSAAAELLGIQKAALARSREAATAAASAPAGRGPEGNGAAAEAQLSRAANAQSKPPKTAPSTFQVAGGLAQNLPTWSDYSP